MLKNLIKFSPFLILTALNFLTVLAHAQELRPVAQSRGNGSSGGGDASEARVDEIRTDLVKWINEGGAAELKLPTRITYDEYRKSMLKVLAPHQTVVVFVTSEQEKSEVDGSERKVSVDNEPKTCRGFVSIQDQLPHILCNIERFAGVKEAEQYRLVHHEYAGLAGVEKNVGPSSDYEVSNQITNYLASETVLRLRVGKPVASTYTCEGSYVSPKGVVLSDGVRFAETCGKITFTESTDKKSDKLFIFRGCPEFRVHVVQSNNPNDPSAATRQVSIGPKKATRQWPEINSDEGRLPKKFRLYYSERDMQADPMKFAVYFSIDCSRNP
jgi:hypothetical protein